jgi:KDO2-lipid IV(A) lauroyltransferase|tara:strand:- start:26983 stop:27957 length:975 start_codon:yes stop_codon:yes gene_type:complete
MNTDKTPPFNTNPKFEAALLHPKYILTWAGMGFLYLCKFLPYSLLIKMGHTLGALFNIISPQRKEIATINLKTCFPDMKEDEIDELVKNNLRNLGVGIFEMALAWWSSEARIRGLLKSFKNKTLLDDLDQNQGVLVLLKHTTHIELDVRLLCLDFELGGMYKPQSNRVISHLMIKARNNYALGCVNNRQAKQAMNWMQNGSNFMYAADQDYGSKVSKFIPFYGIKAATVSFPEILSKLGIKIIIADVARNGGGFDIELHEINPYAQEDSVLKEMNDCYEKVISQSPEEYLWMHRRFKTNSEGQKSIYPRWKSRERRRERRRERA